jgi:hypothetical protein
MMQPSWIRKRFGWFAVVACSIVSCSPGAKQQPGAKRPGGAPVVAAEGESELHRLLAELEPPPPILDGLPAPLRDTLQGYAASLTAEQREMLLQGQDAVVRTRPLLYLAAGGLDPAIVSLLFTAATTGNELVALAGDRAADAPPVKVSLVDASNALAERAALEVLRARASDVSARVEPRREHLEQVAFAASVVRRHDIERLTLGELSERYPDPAWGMALARLDARSLDVESARARLDAVEAKDAPTRAAIESELEAAMMIRQTKSPEAARTPTTLDQRVQLARAWLVLSNAAEAEAVLDGDAAELDSHLALATTFARAKTGASACPLLRAAAVINEPLCQQAWSLLLAQHPLDYIERAWASGNGRDAQAVESHLGLSYVVPLMYGLDSKGQAGSVEWVTRALASIETVATDAVVVDGYFEAVAGLSHALGVAVRASAGDTGKREAIAEPDRKDLLRRATDIAGKQPLHPWGQATALGIAAILSREESIAGILEPLRGKIAREYETTFGALLLWDILADGALDRFREMKPLLGDIATNKDASSFERSKWLFLWAETEAHLSPSLAANETLRKIAESLARENVPLDLRLRATLDLAGLRARQGDIAGAVGLLQPIVEGTPRGGVASHNEQELLIAATGYLMVLRGLLAKGDDRKREAGNLETFLVEIGRANAAPPSVQMWLLLWRAEFDTLIALDACNGAAACEKKAVRQRGVSKPGLAEAVGKRAAELLARGVVPVGGVQIEFRYLGRGRLMPSIEVHPQFVIAHVPPM